MFIWIVFNSHVKGGDFGVFIFSFFFNFTILSYIRPFFSKRLIYTTQYLITSVYAAVFTIIVKWNQPRCPPADEWAAKLQPGCTEAFYTATNIKKINQ